MSDDKLYKIWSDVYTAFFIIWPSNFKNHFNLSSGTRALLHAIMLSFGVISWSVSVHPPACMWLSSDTNEPVLVSDDTTINQSLLFDYVRLLLLNHSVFETIDSNIFKYLRCLKKVSPIQIVNLKLIYHNTKIMIFYCNNFAIIRML